MTRINTNVSSLLAQQTLQRSNGSLQLSLTRLSTGLRINNGKDDPAGLIASENLRRDITSVEKAISNSERANQLIATADSALGQVSGLLNDIRGLVTEAANAGALSDEQIAANQLQVDSSLEAINRIAQTTTFQGRRLLDGSLEFISTAGSVSTIADIRIEQANLGASGQVDVDIDISAAAAQATLDNAAPAGNNAQAEAAIVFAAEARLNGFNDANADISIRAADAGADFEDVAITFVTDGTAVGSEYAVYDSDDGTLQVHINNAAATTAADVTAAIDALAQFTATNNGGAGDVIDGSLAGDAAINDTTDADEIAITAATAGPDFNNLAISVVADSTPVGAPVATYDVGANTLTLRINDSADTTLAALTTAIDNLAEFSAVAAANGDTNVNGGTGDATAIANTDLTGGGTLLDNLVFELSGLRGSEVFSFAAGASSTQITSAINLVSDSLGITAVDNNGTLTFTSTDYGSTSFINVDVISEGASGNFEDAFAASRKNGSDIEAAVNGIAANGDGNTLSINTSTLDLEITVNDGSDSNIDFTISGGGAVFQLGPSVVSNQQARLGIESLNTAKLGGASGRLFELGSGQTAALSIDATKAAQIVDEVIGKVTGLRGRLGAFQRTTLDTNIASLGDTLSNLSEAESAIRDADFAKESAALTRAQILVQSGTSVLAIANQNPQNVLALLR